MADQPPQALDAQAQTLAELAQALAAAKAWEVPLDALDAPATKPAPQPPEEGPSPPMKLAPSEGRLEPESGRAALVKEILPLVLAQSMDGISTEKFLGWPALEGWTPPREGNPLPGMQTSGGRLAWGAAETLAIAALLAKFPTLGKVLRDAMIATHQGLAFGNQVREEAMKIPTGEYLLPDSARRGK